jgi:hypothetical protein
MRISRACRTDANQAEIIAVFEAMGCTVAVTSNAGNGFPDMVVGFPTKSFARFNMLVECKDGAKPPSARKLTAEQQIFHTAWRGQVDVVETTDQAIALVNKYRRA